MIDDSSIDKAQLDPAILAWVKEVTPHGILVTDVQLNINGWNHWLEENTGLKKEAVLGKPLLSVFPDLAARGLERYFRGALEGESSVLAHAFHRYIISIPSPAGISEFPNMQQSASIGPLRSEGRICGTITVITDVTERVHQNYTVRRQQDRLMLLNEALAQLLSAEDPESTINQLFSKITNHLGVDIYLNYLASSKGSQMLLKNAAGLPPHAVKVCESIDPGSGFGRKAAETLLPVIINNFENAEDPDYACFKALGLRACACLPLSVGSKLLGILVFATSKRDRFADDEVQFLTTISQYVSVALDRFQREAALRMNEERFRVMTETVPDIIFTAGADGKPDYINQRFYEVIGRPGKIAESCNWMNVAHPDDRERLKLAWEDSLARQEPFEVECRLYTSDGAYRWYLCRARPLPHAELHLSRWLGAITDIDAQKRASEILEKRVEERTSALKESVSQLESFSYTVSHDLRAPIRTMKGYAHVLLEDYGSILPPDALAYLRRIVASADRMNAMTLDLLNYSRVLRNEIELSTVNLDLVVEEIIALDSALQHPRAEIIVKHPLGLVVGQVTLVSQTITNLLTNAVRFVPIELKPKVVIRSEPTGNHIRLWIEDNGIGIAPEHHDRIFGIFERLHYMPLVEGTGVGLSIVAKAMQRLNGRYGVESQLGEGSRFWIELPRPQA